MSSWKQGFPKLGEVDFGDVLLQQSTDVLAKSGTLVRTTLQSYSIL